MPSAVWPSAGCSSSSRSPIPQWPGTGSICGAGQRQRRRALDVVLVVELAQLALRRARLVAQPRGARLRDAERRVREGVAAEQVVPVGVRRDAADDAEAGLLARPPAAARARRAAPASRPEGLLARLHQRAGGLPEPRRDDDDVGVQPDGLHRYAAPSSFAASRRFLTSAVGFFWLESSVSLLRLTQITGTLAFRHGSTS